MDFEVCKKVGLPKIRICLCRLHRLRSVSHRPQVACFFFGNLRNLFSGLDVEIHHKGLKRNLDVFCTLKNLQKTHGFRWFITLGSQNPHPIWKLGMMERWNPFNERTCLDGFLRAKHAN